MTDFANQGVFAVDYVGNSAPIPLAVEPDDSFVAFFPEGLVALPVDGDSSSANAADRDELYSRSILGGPATEITGGIPQFREISAVRFSEDGGTLVVGTRHTTDNGQGIFFSSKVFFATPGVTGLTPVLDTLHSGIRFLPRGSDASGDYFLFETLNVNSSLPGASLWSVPVANPAAAVQLALHEDNTQIGVNTDTLDAPGSRMLYTSREFEDNGSGQPDVYTLWSEPLDGSSGPAVLAKLPADREPFEITTTAGSPWIFVGAEEPFTIGIVQASYVAVHETTGEQLHFVDPNGNGINTASFAVTSDGSAAVFTDVRTTSNDLYLATPGDVGDQQTILWDVPDDQRLLRMRLSSDDQFVVATVTSASATDTSIAERLVAIPVAGGAPVDLDNGALAAEPYFIASSFYGPEIVGNKVLYLRGNNSIAGFYVVDLPTGTGLTADFDSDGDVDQDDLNDPVGGWQARYGVDLGGDDFLAWQRELGSGDGVVVAKLVPEPESAAGMVLGLLLLTQLDDRRRK